MSPAHDDAPDRTPSEALSRFSAPVRRWFDGQFDAPTPVQERAWRVIAEGRNALVIAPTGSGKTLAAFLFAIDRLAAEKGRLLAKGERWRKGVRVLYVSPLKALGADVERNLQHPLSAISEQAAAAEGQALDIRTAMRTGDTTPDERRRIARNPPDILITTPESLYLMLTSQAREVLATVEAVIVDEVHALAGSKRGAHLSLSLERLDCLLPRPAQRIGLSATVRPPELVARFLGGPHSVEVVEAAEPPAIDLSVCVPVPDMTAIPAYGGAAQAAARAGAGRPPRRAASEVAWKSDRALRAAMEQGSAAEPTPDTRLGSSSIWPHIEAAILDQVMAHRSTIVFVNSRGLCEKLTARLNELYAKRQGIEAPASASAGYWSDAGSAPGPTAYRSDIGGTGSLVRDAGAVVAKAHHGSVSKEKRRAVEAELKRGELPCVVATSSLELGIDMGEVDLVLQVAPPPSVSSGLQRIGRANHQVGGRSAGIVYPRTRPEVVDAAVVAEGMRAGAIEATRLVENPLDVLAQQTVAAVAMGMHSAGEWFDTVRRSACFAELPRAAFDGVLDMLAGRMNSGDLADFSPRILWDRATGALEARPGSQRLAVTAGGTIPDRGMFSVVLPQADGTAGRRRVGELDEEMVMESRVGDVIALGTSTWRITEITGDRVMVEPAPGRSARLPFWHGEAVGRPADLGRARGAFVREVAAGIADAVQAAGSDDAQVDPTVRDRLESDGLDGHAIGNLAALLAAQRQATGILPTDKSLVVEQCQDEAGDWRIILHSPFGRPVHEPWALAVADRIARERGIDAQVMAGDDGIVVRIPLTEEALPGAELFRFDAHELEATVRAKVGSTALFAARFRECAARALLMQPTAPGKRAPLWLQRVKGGQLLEAARREEGFPILLEAMRECLQDVFDMGALRRVMEALEAGTMRMAQARTAVPSPFAAPLIFGYVSEHLYEGDLPHAERDAALLSVDPALLGELLGTPDAGALIDAEVAEGLEAELQRTAEGWRVRDAEGVADLLRALGPLSALEVAERLEGPDRAAELLQGLEAAHRAFVAQVGGQSRWAAADDALRLHAVLAVEAPAWAAAPGQSLPAGDAAALMDGLVARYGRTHGPFTAEDAARRLGAGSALVAESLGRLEARGDVRRLGAAGEETRWVDAGILRRLRARSLAKAREAVRPVAASAYVRFLLDRQGIGAEGGLLEGPEGAGEVIAQFEGVFLPAAQWEAEVLPTRVRAYRPAMLDELLAAGEVVWAARRAGQAAGGHAAGRGQRTLSANGNGVPLLAAFYPADSPLAPVPLGLDEAPFEAMEPEPGDLAQQAAAAADGEGRAGLPADAELARAVVRALADEGPLGFPALADAVREALDDDSIADAAVAEALEGLVAAGRAASDSANLLRAGGHAAGRPAAASSAASQQPPQRRVQSRRGRAAYGAMRQQARHQAAARLGERRSRDDALAGRWALLAPDQAGSTLHAVALVESLLDCYGIVTRDIALLAGVPGGLAALYPVLRAMEDAGDVVRGAFVEGLGPAQFAARQTVDALRSYADNPAPAAADGADLCVALPADDPACLFGAGLTWPEAAHGWEAGAAPDDAAALSHRPTRRAGGLVALAAGAPVLYAAPRLRFVVPFTDDEQLLRQAIGALGAHAKAQARRLGGASARAKLVVGAWNGFPLIATPAAALFQDAGFVRQPDGMRLYVDPF